MMLEDTGVLAEVDILEREDVDRPDLDAEGGDDSAVEEMLAATLADPGPVVDEEQLR
jgi:hypothetical protein